MFPPLKTLLTTLHLLRPSPWSPRTLLDWLLASPLQLAASLLYRHLLLPLRGRPFRPPPHKKPIRVVCISDTHNLTTLGVLPAGDVLVHCGDLTDGGTVGELQAQVDWVRGLGKEGGFGWVVVVGGNHDSWLDEGVRREMGMGEKEKGGEEVDWTGVEYLCDRAVELEFEGGRRLKVYGWGAVPWCGEGCA
jgi:hypothetical protein